jgi:hypothetical protein
LLFIDASTLRSQYNGIQLLQPLVSPGHLETGFQLASKSCGSLYLIDGTVVKAQLAAAEENEWAAPSTSGFCSWHE